MKSREVKKLLFIGEALRQAAVLEASLADEIP
jgi:hypothetical protein